MVLLRAVTLVSLTGFLQTSSGCTNLLVTPSATSSGSAFIAYNADSAALYGSLYHYPATTSNPSNASREIHDWDSGVYLGSIPEAPFTYNVIGNTNDQGLTIAETTFGGLESLCSTYAGSKIDYGSLIYIALQRSASAVEAIHNMGDLVSKHGYASEGESFSIADSESVWILEMIGKGKYELGAVWVAVRIPDGSISAHANQARITTFPRDDPDNAIFAPDVVDFAVKIGAYPADAPEDSFSFSDVYDPLTPSGARFCEARVWNIFSQVLGSSFESEYESYATGLDLTNRMPLYVNPPSPLSLPDVTSLMRSSYTGSSLDFSQDVGAGAYQAPYRWRPLTWDYDDSTYVNERAVGTMQTGWNFVAEIRPSMPKPLQVVNWFGVDDSATTARTPIYSISTAPPASFGGAGPQDGIVPDMMTFDTSKAFWIFNLVANFAYSRWSDVYPVVLSSIKSSEMDMMAALAAADESVLALHSSGDFDGMADFATKFSQNTADSLVADWNKLFGELFVRFRDGYDITPDPSDPECGCHVGGAGYPKDTYERIVKETGDKYLLPDDASISEKNMKGKDKLTLKAFQ